MQYLYQKYAPHLMLLDATYKTTKYTLPLFFAVVKTNCWSASISRGNKGHDKERLTNNMRLESHSDSKIWTGRFWRKGNQCITGIISEY